jgi:hypothetical protein
MQRLTRRIAVGAAIATLAVTSLTGAAHAGPPARQGCVGKTMSALATNQPGPGAFGHGVAAFAQAPDGKPGLGDGIQLLQAGAVSDTTLPNACND